LQIKATNTTSTKAYISAFADWNNDGDYLDDGETVVKVGIVAATGGTQNYTLNFIPQTANTALTQYFVRLRIATDSNSIKQPYGSSPQGEVEDHIIKLGLSTTYSQLTFDICQGDSIKVNNKTYKISGTYFDTLVNSLGCDSIVTTKLTVNPKYNRTQVVNVCQGGSIKVGNHTYTQTGTYTDSLKTTKNCDSIIITNLTVRPKETKAQTVTICSGNSYTIGTHTYTQAGTYKDTLKTTFGCDSVVTTTISIAALQTINKNVSICNGGRLVVGTHVYTISGIYKDTIQGSAGCDTLLITQLTVNSTYNNTQTVKLCQGDFIVVGTKTYSQTGNYTDTLKTSLGCDSIIVTKLTVHPKYNRTQAMNICQGESVQVGNHSYSQTGNYTDSLKTTMNCDSVIITNLTVHPKESKSQNITICPGGSYSIGTHTYTQQGIYTDTLKTSFGCDSLVTTTLSIAALQTVSRNISICDGEKLVIGNHTYNTNGVYTDTIQGSAGCDTVLTTTLTVYPKPIVNLGIDISVCPDSIIVLDAENTGATFLWNNNEITQQISAVNAGTYIVIVTKEICSTSDTIIVQHKPVFQLNLGLDVVLCNKDTLLLNATTNGGSYVWQDGSTSSTFIVSQEGVYYVKVITECSESADTIQVTQEDCDCEYDISNAFSPNNDGMNDKFGVANNCTGITDFKFEIYNRWGNLVFQSTNENDKWDGSYKGAPQPLDSYGYILTYKRKGKNYYKKGSIILIK